MYRIDEQIYDEATDRPITRWHTVAWTESHGWAKKICRTMVTPVRRMRYVNVGIAHDHVDWT